jgi:hypothetical protein
MRSQGRMRTSTLKKIEIPKFVKSKLIVECLIDWLKTKSVYNGV